MKKVLKIFLPFTIVSVLTILTQVGGLIFLLALFISKKLNLHWRLTSVLFVLLYVLISLFIIPPLARLNNRVALPFSGNLTPLWQPTMFLNRHYVSPSLANQMEEVADKMAKLYPETQTHYLDANFPFFDGFPLFPHLSHNDGKKVDLAFYYLNSKTKKPTSLSPSYLGYGVFENPIAGETDQTAFCESKGYWHYGLLGALMPSRSNSENFEVDVPRSKTLIQLLASYNSTEKIFLEPHLKKRWNLSELSIIRFHGCQAVRHDDHIHLQEK